MYASSFNLVKSSVALEFGQPPSRFFSPYGCKILSCAASLPKPDAMPQQGERADATLVNNQRQRRRQEGMERDMDASLSSQQHDKSSVALEFGQPPSRFFSTNGCEILSCVASLPKPDAMPQQGELADATLVNNKWQKRKQEGMERDDDVVQSHPQKFRDWLSMTDDEFKREAAVLRKISRISSLLPTEEWKDFCVRRAQLIKDASKAVAMLYKDIDLVERLRVLRGHSKHKRNVEENAVNLTCARKKDVGKARKEKNKNLEKFRT